MLKKLRRRTIRVYLIFLVGFGTMFIVKKMFKDKSAEDDAVEQEDLIQQQEQMHQLLSQLAEYFLGNQQPSTPPGPDGSELERECREFQEVEQFQEQKRLHELQQVEGVSASKAP